MSKLRIQPIHVKLVIGIILLLCSGWGGQRISIFCTLDMVVVITGGNYLQEDPGREIIEKYILPAVE